MKYVLIADLDEAEEFDDGLYGVRVRYTEPGEGEPLIEMFSEGDIYKIRKRRPPQADSIAMADDWFFWRSTTNPAATLGYVFKD